MATEWFEDDGSGIAFHKKDPTLMIVGDYVPQWIKLPVNLGPPNGGRQLKVLGTDKRTCPKCKAWRVRYLLLEDNWVVAECKSNCGFVVAHYAEDSNG